MRNVIPFRSRGKCRRLAERKAFEAPDDPQLKKYYCLEMYPYPSGASIWACAQLYDRRRHLPLPSDERAQRHASHRLGRPGHAGENAAIKHGIHPQTWTLDNIAT